MASENRFYTLLGFAAKARRCVFGAVAIEKGVKAGKVLLVLLDEGASPRTRKEMASLCRYWETPLLEAGPAGRMAQACGREANKLIGIIDKGFAEKLLEEYNLIHGNVCGGVTLEQAKDCRDK